MGKGHETRQNILDHALKLASRIGLEGLTIGMLAEELQLSKSGLFAHFQSKEALQIQVLQSAADSFTEKVIRPALKLSRGLPRIRALFGSWAAWGKNSRMPGGCPIIAAAFELDDRPGPVRDYLVAQQKEWVAFLAKMAQLAIDEGHFRADADPRQFAQDLYGIMLSWHHFGRLLRDPGSTDRARAAFEALIRAASKPAKK
jgi:AcrR family transcriptional regulator